MMWQSHPPTMLWNRLNQDIIPFFIPCHDIYFIHLEKTDTRTACLWKGTASYWRVMGQGEAPDDAMWVYEYPIPDVAAIRGYGAFLHDRCCVPVMPEFHS